ncbi:MAG TPA: DUF4271 domain-containing protein [Chitinophagaceae bacterium]|nr:DUF4271 domain-containing protein [Chitinophagaceae bacterium]
MNKKYHHFLGSMIFAGALCMAVTVLHAQDTGGTDAMGAADTPHSSSAVQHLKKAAPAKERVPPVLHPARTADTVGKKVKNKKGPTATGVKGIPGRTPAKATDVHPHHDTAVKKATAPARSFPITPGKATRTPKDTIPIARGTARVTAKPVRPPADTLVPLTLPSFAGQSFGHYRAFVQYLLANNAIFNHTGRPLADVAVPRNRNEITASSGAELFYIIIGVLFLLAVIRLSFTKYFSDLFRAFFNPTLSQRQLRDQLSQTPFPALLLNIFFTLSSGLYLFLILRHFNYMTTSRPLYLIPVFMVLFMAVYLIKYVFLRFGGWLFGFQEATSGYVFTLYMVNKVLGVALLPFILILAFSTPAFAGVALDISLILIVMLFVYRYVRAYALVKNQIFFSRFHFFIYLCGFEIAPILIIGKLVLIWLNGA